MSDYWAGPLSNRSLIQQLISGIFFNYYTLIYYVKLKINIEIIVERLHLTIQLLFVRPF